ncbi:MAG: hypothetical protein AAF211_23445, partial [Myxococcota bacterium]
MPDEVECFEGGGCVTTEPDCPNPLDGAGSLPDSEDSGIEILGVSGTPLSETCGCETGLGGWSALPVLLVLVLIRRATLGVVLLLGLSLAGPARAQERVDVRPWIQLDGGPLPGFVDPTPPARWEVRGAVATMRAVDPIVLRTSRGPADFVTALDTIEVAGSVQLGNWFRLGASLPLVRTDDAVTGAEIGFARPAFFLLREVSDTVVMQIIAVFRQPGGPPWGYQPSFTFGFTGRRTLGLVDGLARVQFRGQWPVQEVGSVLWGPRIEAAIGARTRGRVGAGAQLVGSAPSALIFAPARGAWPLEAVGSLHVGIAERFVIDGLVGAGITRGLGSSRIRLGLALRTRAALRDSDLDRVADLFDRCVDIPEDRDRFRDRDGCPEPDNDLDGFLDAEDGCPRRPETFNGYADTDGCPDELAPLTVVVRSSASFERVYIGVGDEGDWYIDERQTLAVAPGRRRITVRAEQHAPIERWFEVPEEGRTIELRLRPIVIGECAVRVESVDGTPLQAEWASEAGTFAIAPDGAAPIALPVGIYQGTLSAPGHLDALAVVEIPRDGVCALVFR